MEKTDKIAATAQHILQKYWGYPQFRPGQEEIITAIAQGQDVLAILPTGGGKSICFQVPGLLRGLTLVVSPLISLMKDQVDQLTRRGIRAVFYDSSLPPAQKQSIETDLCRGHYQFLYVSPERLQNHRFQQLCQNQLHLALIAIDEAHCLSLWGHDFRPSYLQITTFLQKLPHRPPIAAFTATTTPACTADILRFLNLSTPRIFQRSFARENLYLNVLPCATPHQQKLNLIRLLKKHRGQMGIIYCLTRTHTEKLALWLNRLGLTDTPIRAYHGALDRVQRAQIQDDFIAGRTKIIVATNAFGMGVDAPHIRFVIHYQPPANIENYYQEVGRAGRDGARGDCYLLLHSLDWTIPAQFIDRLPINTRQPQRSLQRKKLLLHKLQQMKAFAQLHHPHQLSAIFTSSLPCRQNFILRYFATPAPTSSSPTRSTSPQAPSPPTPTTSIPLTSCHHCDLCTQRSFAPSPQEKHHLHRLWLLRRQLCRALHPDLIPPLIFPQPFLEYLNLLRPTTVTQLRLIPGFGRGFLAQSQLLHTLTKFFQTPTSSHLTRREL